MASITTGLDADLAARQAANYSPELAQQAQDWIEQVTGETVSSPLGEGLKNGATLCRLAYKINPDTNVRLLKKPYVKGTSRFKEMENVTAFIQFCRAVGVPESDNFTTVALYEMKNIGQVITCLHSLGRTVQVNVPGFAGPHLGTKLATKNKREFTLEQRLKAKGSTSKWTEGNSSTNKNETNYTRNNTSKVGKGPPPAVAPRTSGAPLAPQTGPKPGSSQKKPGFSKHDRKRSTEMNSFPCNTYKLGTCDMEPFFYLALWDCCQLCAYTRCDSTENIGRLFCFSPFFVLTFFCSTPFFVLTFFCSPPFFFVLHLFFVLQT